MTKLYMGNCTKCGTSWTSICKTRKYCDTCKIKYHSIPDSVAKMVLTRDGYKCTVCGRSMVVRADMDLHHVEQGGDTSVANLVTVCSNKLGKKSCHAVIHREYLNEEAVAEQENRPANYKAAYDRIVARYEKIRATRQAEAAK